MTQRNPLTTILNSALLNPTTGCVVGKWEAEQSEEDQTLLASIKEVQDRIDKKNLFIAISSAYALPFKLTAFKAHLKGMCSCQKN